MRIIKGIKRHRTKRMENDEDVNGLNDVKVRELRRLMTSGGVKRNVYIVLFLLYLEAGVGGRG